MTAEVVVMNRGGVALAADSAVSIQVGDTSKVRDSALKLFMLSKYRPVGVMVYENSSLLGVPWETVIKLFREELGQAKHEQLTDYGKELIKFLDGNQALFPQEVQDLYYRRAVETEYRRIEEKARLDLVDSRVHTIGDQQASKREDAEWVEEAIRHAEKEWDSRQSASYFDSVSANDVMGRNSAEVSELINRVFGSWGIDSNDWNRLLQIARHLVAKDELTDELFSGVVIAGFGESEHFPSVQHIEIGGIFGGKLKVRPYQVHTVSEDSPSQVMSFADTEMVDGFLDGISQPVLHHLKDAVAFIRELPVQVIQAMPDLGPEEKTKLTNIVRAASKKKAAEFEKTVRGRLIDRWLEIEKAVEVLTINELAQVASTLVSLSSFQQQMSLGRQTIGGPVDLAVISKGDGFIWLERKHYFRPELNNQFFENYFGHSPKQ